ncbi:MAG: VWA domain-containing protein [Thermodesulfobacteriota bacterium]
MSFSHPFALYALWLVPLSAFLLIAGSRSRKTRLARYADSQLLPQLAGLESRARKILRGLLFLSGITLALFALAGPRFGESYQVVRKKGVDVMACVDVSRSMTVGDVSPDRLARAKRELTDFLAAAAGDRVGLVAFAGQAFLQCPLTLDHGALSMYIQNLSPDLVPVAGTDLADAIDVALSSFDDKVDTDRVILLITDGEDNEGRAIAAARRAKEKGVRIFVFGIGDTSGGPVPANEGGGFEKDSGGRMVLSRLDEKGLSEIARITGGEYVRSEEGDLDLDRIYYSGIREKTQSRETASGKVVVHEERFYIFLAAAFFLLLVEALLRERYFPRNL